MLYDHNSRSFCPSIDCLCTLLSSLLFVQSAQTMISIRVSFGMVRWGNDIFVSALIALPNTSFELRSGI